MTPRFSPLVALACTLLLSSLMSAAPAQERRVPSSLNDIRLSYAPIVQRAAPTVVNVYAAKPVVAQNPFGHDPIFRRFFGQQGGGEQVQRSLGSGVLVDASGLVGTNNHVIEGAGQVKGSVADRREFEAERVLKAPRPALAMLRLKAPGERFPV